MKQRGVFLSVYLLQSDIKGFSRVICNVSFVAPRLIGQHRVAQDERGVKAQVRDPWNVDKVREVVPDGARHSGERRGRKERLGH